MAEASLNTIGLVRMKWLDRFVFPRGELLNFLIIAGLSGVISFWLTGRQIYRASWGLIDDHEIFDFLGPGLHLSLNEIWSTMMTKTEIGTLQGRFRPAYYVIKLTETSLFGADVHLWYLANTIGFAMFLTSVWWFMRRFVGIWLAGAFTFYISLLRLWVGVWSRLGPSEIGGATCIGVMLFATYFILFAGSARTKNLNAIILALATVALIGMKETFIPLAGGTFAVFVLAGIRKNLSLPVITVLSLLVIAGIGGVAVVVEKQVLVSNTDYYAKSIETWQVLRFAIVGCLVALLRTSWLFLVLILLFTMFHVIPRKSLRGWITDSGIALGAYIFLVVTYALQCALYRSSFPLHSRYDFPAMLLVPLSACILACYAFYAIRPYFPEQKIERAQLATAAALFLLTLGSTYFGSGPSLTAAVQTNIEMTNAFYGELQLALRAAAKSPESPIILEAYGPGAYESVFSLSRYLPVLGARNRISVRLHPDTTSQGKLYDGLQQGLSDLEAGGTDVLVPLRDSLANHPEGCISIAINGSPDPGCAGFQVKTL
jgi:hypothetical protein